jgi:hypothetical protein
MIDFGISSLNGGSKTRLQGLQLISARHENTFLVDVRVREISLTY